MALESYVQCERRSTGNLILLGFNSYLPFIIQPHVYSLPTDPSLSHELHPTVMNLEGRVGLETLYSVVKIEASRFRHAHNSIYHIGSLEPS
jgi:hypothetical protein